MSSHNEPSRPLSQRSASLSPFHVMDILAQAKRLSQLGRRIFHLEVGEPDFATAQPIIDAGINALRDYCTHYTAATGLPKLRAAVAAYYDRKFSLSLDPRRVIITPGASGAIQLSLACLLDAGENVLLADPGYPCNRNIAQVLANSAVSVPVDAASHYQLCADDVAKYWNEATRAAMVASPSNPAGSMLPVDQLRELQIAVRAKHGMLIVDEIYQGLVYGGEDGTVLSITDDCFVVNSFSKYFGMTGWRVGWMVVPEEYVDVVDRIAQNIFLAPPTMSQYAALKALEADVQPLLDQRRDSFRQRRDFLLPALRQLGFEIAIEPRGAFYIYADCSAFTDDSHDWVRRLLDQQGVAITPGIDFGEFKAQQHCRFAYTQSIEQMERAIDRVDAFIRG